MRIISNKILCIVTGVLLLIACSSCKNIKHYRVGEYLNDLAYSTGVNLNLNEEDSFNSLKEFKVVQEDDIKLVNEDLNISFLKRTINNFINDDNKTDYILLNIFNDIKKDNQLVNKEEAKLAIENLVEEINNPKFEDKTIVEEKDNIKHVKDGDNGNYQIGDILYFEDLNEYRKIIDIVDGTYIFEKADFSEVYEKIDISGEYEIDFGNAEIIDFNDELTYFDEPLEISNTYDNNLYNLLGVKRHNFNKEGFNVAYTINSGTIDFRISKSINKGMTMYFDTSISSIKPTYKWDNSGDNLQAFFKVDFDMTNEIGVSSGKYNNYYLDFKNLDSSNLLSSLKKLNTKSDVLEATIPICTIKTPIPNIPTAYFNIDVLAKFYLSGRVELLLKNEGSVGFEIKDNKFRLINDVEKDYDFTIGASARSVAGLNFNICSSDYRLMDIELDAGIRASVDCVLHLFDDEGNMSDEKIAEEYYALYDATKENENVALCGDLSLNWVMELNLNTSKSLLYKYGFTRKKTILDKSDQLFNNLTHIENFQFVKSCSHKNKKRIVKKENVQSLNSEKIILDKYSLVIIKGRSASLPIKSLPKGYSKEDLRYETSEKNVATVNKNGIIDSQDLGTCKITIKTFDDKYEAYLNVLVSTG